MLPQLPFDVIVYILRSVTPSRLDDGGPKSLVSCLQVDHFFHEACRDPIVWKPHYEIRYKLFEPDTESERRNSCGDNWQALYAQRRRIDKTAMAYLQDMVLYRTARYDRAADIRKMGLDVWDMLDIVRHLPIPVSFRISNSEPDGIAHAHALTRRYWANLMADAIVKCSALDVWESAVKEDDSLSSPESEDVNIRSGASFEHVMSAFSCFFGIPVSDITSQLDQLASECQGFLVDEGMQLDVSDPTYDVRRVCKGICQFMYKQGFGIAVRREYRKMLNHFPHSYLTTNKKTLPISLVHIFVAICTRLGIIASPVNFPGTVLAYVATQVTGDPGVIVNPSLNPAACIVDTSHLELMRSDPSMTAEGLSRHLVPCKASTMLARQSYNLAFAFQQEGTLDFHQWVPAMFAVVLAQFVLMEDPPFLAPLTHSFGEVLTLLDCSTFISKLSERATPPYLDLLTQLCDPIRDGEKEAASTRRVRQDTATVRYFVGMVFRHVRYDYVGCIFGWDFTCLASEGWIKGSNVDDLDRGRNQPFYHAFAEDATPRYVAEENIMVINPGLEIIWKLYRAVPELPVHFEDVELNEVGGTLPRGRLLLSPDAKLGYPQDDEVGARWVRDGRFPY